nr:dihydrodipicolinate synthase family protein [Tropicimonas sp. IMCC34043]
MSRPIDRQTNGVFVICATPFKEDGTVDHDSLARLVAFYIGHGVTGMTILGMMGEADKLDADEQRGVIDTVLAHTGDLPVVVGVSNPGLTGLSALTSYAMDKGAAGVMIAPTRGPAREDRVEGYFHAVCDQIGTNVPVVFQDFPLSTGVPVSPALIRKLTEDLTQIVMLKHEDWPGMPKLTRLRQDEAERETPRLSILCGNGGLYLPQELQRGADGAMTGFAYPEALVQTVAMHQQGNPDAAEDLFDRYIPILRHEQQIGLGLAIRKYILMKRGAIAHAGARAPGPRLSSIDAAEIDRLMRRLEAKLAA